MNDVLKYVIDKGVVIVFENKLKMAQKCLLWTTLIALNITISIYYTPMDGGISKEYALDANALSRMAYAE